MKPFTAVRQDQRFHRPERSGVSIAQEVFEAQPGTAGRRWILDPPIETRRAFWDRFGAGIAPQHETFVAEGRVLIEGVRDCHERPLAGLEGRAGEAALFFVDLVPEASWSHPCVYILIPTIGEPLRIEHGWPPSDAVRLVPLPRPPGT